MKKETEKILDPAYSSYHGKVHIPYITTKPKFFSDDKKIIMNTACAGHVVAGIPKSATSAPAEADEQ